MVTANDAAHDPGSKTTSRDFFDSKDAPQTITWLHGGTQNIRKAESRQGVKGLNAREMRGKNCQSPASSGK